mmetsp:Transcript_67238/g.136911  ORF Transcript_67238/g.136911 Transcript_67238/m.136911 type:complete len:237 (-) Transcript_67238:52-762(-)
MGSHLSVVADSALKAGSVVKFPEASPGTGTWTISYNSVQQKMQIYHKATPGGAQSVPIEILSSGGNLHGTWSAESIISASDRRLKQDVAPLYQTLLERGRGKGGPAAAAASELLASLRPRRFGGDSGAGGAGSARYAFEADEMEQVLPGVVRQAAGGSEGIVYQDLLAVIALAAKERQRRLDLHQAQEVLENAIIEEQDSLLQALWRQLDALRRRFLRLRLWSPSPPPRRGGSQPL